MNYPELPDSLVINMTENKNWPDNGEQRIDRIAASHGDGEHYEILDKQSEDDKNGDSSES